MLAGFQASYTALAAKHQQQLESAQAALTAKFEQRLLLPRRPIQPALSSSWWRLRHSMLQKWLTWTSRSPCSRRPSGTPSSARPGERQCSLAIPVIKPKNC